nr:AI-2E family transporter [Amphibacillus sediminis]
MTNNKLFRSLIYTLLIFTIIYLIHLTGFIFKPVGLLIAAIAVPIIGAGVLYYITNPLVSLLERYKVPRIVGILIVFVLIILFAYLSIYFIIPPVQEQFALLVDNMPKMIASFEELIDIWQNRNEFLPSGVEDTIQNVLNNLDSYIEHIMGSLFSFIGSLFSFVFSIVLIPFFLFFMLKDGHKLVPFITSFFSESKAQNIERLFTNISRTLASFIQGQFLVSFCVGIMLLIGYLSVGLNYALMLALFGLFMNLIPFIGPWISAIPAVIIGFFQDPMIGLWTAVIMIVAQQIESNFISPNVMGKVLKLHPLTVITIILAAGAMAGFVGFLLAVPTYAVAKTIITHFYELYTNNLPAGKKTIL